MKRMIAVILLLTLTFALCACSQDPADTQPQTTAAPQANTTTAPETTAANLKALAESCIDKSVDELIALIGEPVSSEYVPSCLGNGEDGNLYYDGFTVFTYREGDTETVTYVE